MNICLLNKPDKFEIQMHRKMFLAILDEFLHRFVYKLFKKNKKQQDI